VLLYAAFAMVIVDSSIVLVALPWIGADPGVRARGSAALAAPTYRPVVELNRAVAVGLADAPAAGLAMLEPLLADPRSSATSSLHAAHAEPLSRAGDAAGAVRAYKRAIAFT
jgi:predicted RNA polymerase sigma factor